MRSILDGLIRQKICWERQTTEHVLSFVLGAWCQTPFMGAKGGRVRLTLVRPKGNFVALVLIPRCASCAEFSHCSLVGEGCVLSSLRWTPPRPVQKEICPVQSSRAKGKWAFRAEAHFSHELFCLNSPLFSSSFLERRQVCLTSNNGTRVASFSQLHQDPTDSWPV